MSTEQHFESSFTLDRHYYLACYDETAQPLIGIKPYAKAALLCIAGLGLAAANVPAYLSYFIIGLGVIEGLSVRFNRSWWLWRQLLSKAANNTVSVTVNERGIRTHSQFVNQQWTWQQIVAIEEKPLGFVLQLDKGRQYLLKQPLSTDCQAFIRQQACLA
ncbi:YcxB family protein [Shewanella sp. NIFS-20-20]|uniref:YcxB family protein n=1 Tax=Shewanella sp. NIFS-20-20 TaxID=2853806 RepID=UPI001C47AFC6|nr:YcxB family protein [Shewanella sp. NIFS-20-20]MBV7314453.1 YcxB family protein [Shewanella sp. NIFS-20-20]